MNSYIDPFKGSRISYMPVVPPALSRLREIGPVFRSKDAVAAGVSWRDLYALRDRGEILELSRGPAPPDTRHRPARQDHL
jgi:hypothetical protein